MAWRQDLTELIPKFKVLEFSPDKLHSALSKNISHYAHNFH